MCHLRQAEVYNPCPDSRNRRKYSPGPSRPQNCRVFSNHMFLIAVSVEGWMFPFYEVLPENEQVKLIWRELRLRSPALAMMDTP